MVAEYAGSEKRFGAKQSVLAYNCTAIIMTAQLLVSSAGSSSGYHDLGAKRYSPSKVGQEQVENVREK
jgi:hypothetical protein